ncbi:MAG: aminodeoxychorismate synthase component I [Candidatus Gracilibacteria bacterium]|nr:aminodeoxychorismate synthase component I [Candidatus Peregrinibacteria bacterium]
MPFVRLEYRRQSLQEGQTPQAFFDHVQGEYACLLESGKHGRYSYVAYDPFAVLWMDAIDREMVQVLQLKDFFGEPRSKAQILEKGQEWPVLEMLEKFELKAQSPVPFCGGAAGYVSYDYGCRFVGVNQKVFDDVGIPSYIFGMYDKVIAFDHEENQIYFLAIAETDVAAQRKLDEMERDLEKPIPFARKGSMGMLSSNVSQETYIRKVKKVQEYLKSGDTYQVNFSQRFSGDCSLDPWTVYKRLAQQNPSPFACYFDYPDFQIVSCSPELLLRKRGMKVESWPIKGTVARGRNPQEDEKNTQELIDSVKDDAELSMIVDLVRNDLGKVCEVGSVGVQSHRDVEHYSHVIHTVSRVSGKLDKKRTFFDLMQALFPGGSITGCPKKRTMEIIDELEDFKRGVYTGSAGFISFLGESDFNILIRTMLHKDGKVHFHAGGGIVIDSDPEKEYQETLDKIEALRAVLD